LSTPEQLFADLLRARPANPFVTYYDEATGERSELSAKSLANWVAKTHHLLSDELGLGPGDTALLGLPLHWISVPIVLGCLTAGVALTDGGAADVAFVTDTADHIDATSRPTEVFAVNAARAAVGYGDAPPSGSADYVAAVRPQPDTWASVQFAATPHDPCIDGRSRRDVAVLAQQRAMQLGVGPSARVLTSRPWRTPDDWVDTLLAPLAVTGSVVYVVNCTDEAVLERRAAQERVTSRV